MGRHHCCCSETSCVVSRFDATDPNAYWTGWDTVAGTVEQGHNIDGSLYAIALHDGKIRAVRTLPESATGWQLAVRLLPYGHAGKKIKLGIGGKTVEFTIGTSVEDGPTVTVSDAASNTRTPQDQQLVLYGPTLRLRGDSNTWYTIYASVEPDGEGSFLIRTENCRFDTRDMDLGSYDQAYRASYATTLAKVAGEPGRELTIETDAAIPINRIEVSLVRYAYDGESYDCNTQFWSPCSFDPETWNANGSPCCLGGELWWVRPGGYSEIFGLRWAHTSSNTWSTNLYAKDWDDPDKKVIAYHPTLTITGNVYRFTLKHPVSGATIFEQEKALTEISVFRDALDAPASFRGDTSESQLPQYANTLAHPWLLANFGAQYSGSYYDDVRPNWYQPGCIASRRTCEACLTDQYVGSVTVEVPDGPAAGAYVVPISECYGGKCFPGAVVLNDRTCCVIIHVDFRWEGEVRASVALAAPKPSWGPCDCTFSEVPEASQTTEVVYGTANYVLQGEADCSQPLELAYDDGDWLWWVTDTQYEPLAGRPSAVTITPNLVVQI